MLIAFGHKKNVGKDTAAHIILQLVRGERFGFADSLKEMLGVQSDIDRTARRPELQRVGQAMRAQDPNFWINRLGDRMAKRRAEQVRDPTRPLSLAESFRPTIITDLRFPNEVEWVRAQNGYVVRIDRPDAPVDNDESETALNFYDQWDDILLNDGTQEDFERRVIECFVNLMIRELERTAAL